MNSSFSLFHLFPENNPILHRYTVSFILVLSLPSNISYSEILSSSDLHKENKVSWTRILKSIQLKETIFISASGI